MELEKLKDLFDPDDIEWRFQSSGTTNNNKPYAKVLAYVTNRAIMDRLDEVCGPENWANRFDKGPSGGIICGIAIKIGKTGNYSDWVEKWDGAENTDFEPIKGGLSNSMKRAAVQWGIGRYLYKLKENWATFNTNGKFKGKVEGTWYAWNPPTLPDWAIPEKTSPDTEKTEESQPEASESLKTEDPEPQTEPQPEATQGKEKTQGKKKNQWKIDLSGEMIKIGVKEQDKIPFFKSLNFKDEADKDRVLSELSLEDLHKNWKDTQRDGMSSEELVKDYFDGTTVDEGDLK